MKVLSLFDGLGGARVALDSLGIIPELYLASEIDKYAVKIAEKNYKDITHIGDVNSIYNHLSKAPLFDLIIGGFPCQDLSLAKKNRQGLRGNKSSLFWGMVRIIFEFPPKYFLIENVASMSLEAVNEISSTLQIQPKLINSALLTGQCRKRLYWTNIPNVSLPEDKGVYLKDIIEIDGNVTDFYINKDCYMDTFCPSYNEIEIKEADTKNNKDFKGRPVRVGSINKGGQGQRIYSISSGNEKSITLSASSGGQGAKTGLYYIPNKGVRRLTPIECERLQGLPDNYTEGVSNTQRYKMLGNGFTVPIISHILSFMPK